MGGKLGKLPLDGNAGRSKFIPILLVLGLPVMAGLLAGCPNNPSPVAGNPAPAATPCSGFFGNSTPSATTSGAGTLYFSPFSTSATPSLLQSMSVSIASGGTQFELGVYSNGGGAPATLLRETGAKPVTGSGWHKASVTGLSLAASTTYWLAVFTDGSFGSTLDGGVGSHGAQTWSTFGSLPATFTGTVTQHMTLICITPPCPPGIPIPLPMPGLLLSVYGTTCP